MNSGFATVTEYNLREHLPIVIPKTFINNFVEDIFNAGKELRTICFFVYEAI